MECPKAAQADVRRRLLAERCDPASSGRHGLAMVSLSVSARQLLPLKQYCVLVFRVPYQASSWQ
eukprot:15347312-Alexandrium_andersonii.AAC.1